MAEAIKLDNNGQANERLLFHGTSKLGAEGISKSNFDDRFYKSGGLFGHGAYFADDPNKSNGYADKEANGMRHMFLCKVLLGKEQKIEGTKKALVCSEKGYNSIVGYVNANEYIVYRYGQAKPLILVEYK